MHQVYPLLGCAEPFSSSTHLIGAAVFLILSFTLLRKVESNKSHFISMLVFGFSCVFLLLMSGVYHLLPRGELAREVLQRLDHAAIYVLIAGTITAVHAVLFSGARRWLVILLAWILAGSGVVLKTVFFKQFPESWGLISYLAFGWLGVASGIMLYKEYGFAFVRPLLLGGFAYTGGAVLEFFREPIIVHGIIGPHEVFHLAVLLGISYHWQFIHTSLNAPRKLGAQVMREYKG